MSAPGVLIERRPPVTGGTGDARGGGSPSGAAGSGGRLCQLLLAVLCAGYAAGAAVGWGSEEVALIMGDFGLSAAALVAAVSCFVYARTRGSRFRPAWLLFAFSSAMAAGGNTVWGWYEVVLDRAVPQPSVADLFFLLFAPPAIVGLLVLAKRPVTRAGWICLGLDSWLIGGSLLTLSWSLALAHTARFEGESVARAALSLAYPLLDIVLVSMVLALHFRRSQANRSAVRTAIAALALTVLCDALFTSPLLRDHYRSGQLLDAGWFAGSLLLAYAPWGADRAPESPAPPRGPRPHSRPVAGSLAALTPYLAAAVCTLGILYNVIEDRTVDRVVVFTGCTVVLALVVRQGIMLLDNIALTHELAQKENHFRSLVQGSSDVIMIAAPDGVLRYVSPAASGVYGREADELIGSELASLIHPEDLGAVVHEVRRFLATPPSEEPTTRIECRFRSGTGDWLNVESTVNRHQGGLIFNSRDVTERVRLQAQLQYNAEHDPLTDLPNRALFTHRVRQALSGRRAGDAGTAVLFIDLDGFKGVNDRLGHQAGDELLVQAARRLQESVRAGDTAARLGGDEFAALILGDGSRDPSAREPQVLEIADRLRLTLSQPYRIEGREVRVAASIGVAFAEAGINAGDLLRNADLAMYRAKAGGKNRVELYAPQMQADVVRRTELASRKRTASREGEFVLLHQPVVDLATGRITAVAAQPRWRSARGVLHTAAEYLRVAEEPERAAEFDGRLLEEAVEQAAERGRLGHHVPVSVRFPARKLVDRSMPLGTIEALLTKHRLPSGSLIIELSDSDPRISFDELEQRLASLRRLGVRVALDGFGSGYAAINALRRLPVDILKLDRGLVEGVVESARLHKITSGLLRIACDLGMQSVADGVDVPEQVLALRAMGCTHGQGAAFSGPLDEHRLRRALARGVYPVPGGSVLPAFTPGTRPGLLPATFTGAVPGARSGIALPSGAPSALPSTASHAAPGPVPVHLPGPGGAAGAGADPAVPERVPGAPPGRGRRDGSGALPDGPRPCVPSGAGPGAADGAPDGPPATAPGPVPAPGTAAHGTPGPPGSHGARAGGVPVTSGSSAASAAPRVAPVPTVPAGAPPDSAPPGGPAALPYPAPEGARRPAGTPPGGPGAPPGRPESGYGAPGASGGHRVSGSERGTLPGGLAGTVPNGVPAALPSALPGMRSPYPMRSHSETRVPPT
ncbi:membrane associated phosphodiesterase [Streptomyces lavendofoliae]|uniref:Membrane associated phosphodiesterase n=1 Tax=Streptomyces lavendofoliae TaxID=67314 RepID=A0A918HYE6_9ACTN|nr:membrane associated phosphodiesterase [Streptomyces lavendofoliae]